ncbi:MAG: hypothetical protein ACR2PI_11855 [Hyphomicrobiaceae bacterium]
MEQANEVVIAAYLRAPLGQHSSNTVFSSPDDGAEAPSLGFWIEGDFEYGLPDVLSG